MSSSGCWYYFGQGVGAGYSQNVYGGFHNGTVDFLPAIHPAFNVACVRLYLNGNATSNYYGNPYGKREQYPQEKLQTGCNISTKYDCINGACISSLTYSTPGLYQSLSECEVACGIGCSGKCLSNEDWAQIEGLAAQLKNKNCS